MKRSALVLLSTLGLIATATAQANVHLYSSFSKGGVPAADCIQAESVILPLLVKFNAPRDWNWVIVCDEVGWKKAEHQIDRPDNTGVILGATFLKSHTTYIRGYAAVHPVNYLSTAQPEHTIAHELGHILLNTANEDKAERKADELMKTVSVVASK